jgi:hypothetical protein
LKGSRSKAGKKAGDRGKRTALSTLFRGVPTGGEWFAFHRPNFKDELVPSALAILDRASKTYNMAAGCLATTTKRSVDA